MFINPYDYCHSNSGKWFRCNFHTHAGTGPGTCGSYGLDEVIFAYWESGYDILMISNHDIYTDTKKYSNIYMIQGVEYSTHPHMLTVGIEEALNSNHQDVIDKTRQRGGFVILCHPNWMRKHYLEDDFLNSLTGYRGIEILNTVIYRLSGSGFACDTWDRILTQGKLAYGFGNDDFHVWCDLCRSWNVVFSKSLSYFDIKEAIDAGCFYVSSGLALAYLQLENGIISIKANYIKDSYVDDFGYEFIGENGECLSSVKGKAAFYTISGKEKYIRIAVTSEEGFKLFTQPIYQQGFFKDP